MSYLSHDSLPTDLIVSILTTHPHDPRMWTEIGGPGEPRAVMIALYPDLTQQSPAENNSKQPVKAHREVIFVVDR